jgi:glutathione synthase/RimK-type ligase-like ATP-grasp enzyme
VAFVNHAAIVRSRIRLGGDSKPEFLLSCDRRTYDLETMSAAYLRPYNHRHYEQSRDRAEETAGFCRSDLVNHLVNVWAENSNALIINRPSGDATNHSKLDQARAIRMAGFLVPDSLVTNDPGQAKDFLSRHGRVIYKSMSSVRSIVKELQVASLHAVERLGPVFFQQRITGQNIRVHVIGEKAVSCAVCSDGVDYRYAPSRIEPMTLPEDVTGRCVALTARLGLVLSGIDLIANGDDYYCLEVNPNPAFSSFDPSPDRPVAHAVAEALM